MIRLGRIFGVDTYLHRSWIIFVAIIAILTYAQSGAEVAMNTVGYILMLFFAVFIHEHAHIAMARHYGIGTRMVVLHMFGGAAMLKDIPLGRRECFIGIVGPLCSLTLAIVPHITLALFGYNSMDIPGIGHWVLVNFILGVFNCLPIFPLDGGRVLRSLLYGAVGKPVVSTKITLAVGWITMVMILWWTNFSLWLCVLFVLVIMMGLAELDHMRKRNC